MLRQFGKYWFPVLVYAAIIFYWSSLTHPLGELSLFPHSDKIIHFFEFGFLGLLLRRALANASVSYFKERSFILTITLGIMYGFTDEFHQSFVPGREVGAWDLFFDSIGVLGSLLVRLK